MKTKIMDMADGSRGWDPDTWERVGPERFRHDPGELERRKYENHQSSPLDEPTTLAAWQVPEPSRRNGRASAVTGGSRAGRFLAVLLLATPGWAATHY
jgi:hypothetical protein